MSKKLRFSNIDWKKIGIGLLIALGGALATYLEETIPGVDFGLYTPLAVALNSMVVNAIRKFFASI